ncbi:uncharacterized protein LOC116013635 [Ipomoea triloba]|uniref:uncharacterized protein LOC116013333 n=1 Tax=Ipomoea triloba TaxID=35885 RepID=UPI00125E1663|nr:uncharacterized protein LOC116013333 [Ipomoea triloba]XP_031109363.1 uncharacterized protein LOC116013635 [Ipomoea triloba]
MTEDSLSAKNSPAATARSPEDEDLLQRNTKKMKRPRDSTEKSNQVQPAEIGQETTTFAGLKSPDSTRWQTPVETPNTAWGRKNVEDPFDKETASDDEIMGDERADPNCPIIRVTKEEKERLRRPWRRTLIIKLLGRKVSYSFLINRLQRMWKPEAGFDLIALDQDFYLAKFESLRDYEFAKYDGPWIILGHYLTVQEWVPNFIPWKNKLDKLLVWIRFPSLPIEYFEEEFLMKIGREVGRPVKVDYTTSLVSKGKFGRICVELDMTKPLLSKFTLAEEVWPIEYEGIHMVCFKCGIYSHKQGQCGGEGSKDEEIGDQQLLEEAQAEGQ